MAYPSGDSVRTKIRKAIEYGLGTITIGSGYNVTTGDVHRQVESPEKSINFPGVSVDFVREEYRMAVGQRSLGWCPKRAFVDLRWDVKNIDAINEQESKVLADCEKYFLNRRHIPDSSGNATVYGDTMFINNERMGMEANVPSGRVVTHLRINYLQSKFDPTVLAMSTSVPTNLPLPPSSVSVSRRESARLGLLRNLNTVAIPSYKTTMHANPTKMSFEQLLNKVEVNIIPESEDVVNIDDYGLTDNLAHKVLGYRIEANATDVDNIVEERENVVADLEYLFANNWTLPDSSGHSTVIEAFPTYNEVLGIGTDEPDGMVRMGLRCLYTQELLDPTKPVFA